jgi:hypothetical protein
VPPQARLSPAAKKGVYELLHGATLASVSADADNYRNSHRESSRWHHVNIPLDAARYDPARDCRAPGSAFRAITVRSGLKATQTVSSASRSVSCSPSAEGSRGATHRGCWPRRPRPDWRGDAQATIASAARMPSARATRAQGTRTVVGIRRGSRLTSSAFGASGGGPRRVRRSLPPTRTRRSRREGFRAPTLTRVPSAVRRSSATALCRGVIHPLATMAWCA